VSGWLLKELVVEKLLKFLLILGLVKPIFTKTPNYLVRLEYMYEDLMKLPFILEVLNTSQLEMLCSHGKPIEDWEQFYDQETKDFVYSLTKHHFDVWGYEK